ncbi:MAG: hypothetical protein PHE09_03420 [Oscillospiraceae bacterium]|nr:hypothetical protein [Oscillospiraceae bacterium]
MKKQREHIMQAKTRAVRSGQPTPKLDKKLEKVNAGMNSIVQPVRPAIPSASKYRTYKDAEKRPVQGGKVSPK